jgi:hypothetical protein
MPDMTSQIIPDTALRKIPDPIPDPASDPFRKI